MIREETGLDPSVDFRLHTTNGRKIAIGNQSTSDAVVEQQILAQREREATATPRTQVQPARFRKTTMYGE